VGDHALRQVAAALQTGLRSYDLCVRYAGDEFIIVLAECSREAAEVKRREIQQRVSEIEIEVRAGKTMHLAASAGAAVFPHDGTSYETLLADADQRMYRDKALRRARRAATPKTVPTGPAGFAVTDVFGPSAKAFESTVSPPPVAARGTSRSSAS
jgi:diguanylate cyclase (GGDEF)-like protein